MELLVLSAGMVNILGFFILMMLFLMLKENKNMEIGTRFYIFMAALFGVFSVIGFTYFLVSFIPIGSSSCGSAVSLSCQSAYLLEEIKPDRWEFFALFVASACIALLTYSKKLNIIFSSDTKQN